MADVFQDQTGIFDPVRAEGYGPAKKTGMTAEEASDLFQRWNDEARRKAEFREQTAASTGVELSWKQYDLLYDMREQGVIDDDDVYRISFAKELGEYLRVDPALVLDNYDAVWRAVSEDREDRYALPKSRLEAALNSIKIAKNSLPMAGLGNELMGLHGQLEEAERGKNIRPDAAAAFEKLPDDDPQRTREWDRLTPDEQELVNRRRRADEVWGQIREIKQANEKLARGMPTDALSTIITSTIQSAPMTGKSMIAGAAGAAAGGAVGALAGSAAAGVGAAPGFAAGAKMGYNLASMAASATEMVGLMYADLLDAGVTRENARRLAIAGGSIQGVIEGALGTVAGWGKSAVKIIGGKALSKGAQAKIAEVATKHFIKRVTGSGLMASIGKHVVLATAVETLKQAGEEGIEEVLQALVDQAALSLADAMQDAPVDRNSWGSPEFWDVMKNSLLGGIAGGLGFGVMGLPLNAGGVTATVREMDRVKNLAQVIDDKAEFKAAVKDSPIFEGVSEERVGQVYDSQAPERRRYQQQMREEAARAGEQYKLASMPTLEAPGEMRRNADGRLAVRIDSPAAMDGAGTGTLTVFDPPTRQQMGRLEFGWDAETNTITVETMELSEAVTNREAVFGDMLKELSHANPDMGVEWDPDGRASRAAGVDLAALKNSLIAENPRGPDWNLRFYERGDRFAQTRQMNEDIDLIAQAGKTSRETASDIWEIFDTAFSNFGLDTHEMIGRMGLASEEDLREAAAAEPGGVAAQALSQLEKGQAAAQGRGNVIRGAFIAVKRGADGGPDQVVSGRAALDEAFERLRGVTVLAGRAKPSTVLHEWMHFMATVVIPNSPRYRYLLEEAFDKKLENFTREDHEKLSRQFEQYMRTGEAPTAGLRALFKRIADALRRFVRSAELSPELRRFFDQMLAGPDGELLGGETGRGRAAGPRARVRTDNEQQRTFAGKTRAQRILQSDLYTRDEKLEMLYAMGDAAPEPEDRAHAPTAALISRAMAIPDAAARERVIADIRELRGRYAGTTAEYTAPNGKPSNLIAQLGEEQGRQAWYAVRTADFKQWFGDWEGLEYQEMPSNDWPADFEDLLSVFETEDSGGWKLLGGIDGYENAKHQRDEAAAEEVIRQVFELHPEAKEKIKAIAGKHPNAIVARVFRPDGNNRLPTAYAEAIGDMTGLEVDRSIVQTNRTGRTKQKDLYRLANRNAYDGQVKAGREYIIVDDVYSRGGSLSELRRFIEQRGGKVVLFSTLADGGKGTRIALTEETRAALLDKHGEKAILQFAKELDLYGGNYKAFTEQEARYVLEQTSGDGAVSLDALRDRILAERIPENRRLLSQSVHGQTPLNKPANYIDPSEVSHVIDENGEPLAVYHQTKELTEIVNAPDMLFQLVGEQGAAALDRAEEVTFRMKYLSTARQMEARGMDAKKTRLATGWERGADGKWRYEIPDVTLKENAPVTWDRDEPETGRLALGDMVDGPELFSAYPELREMEVTLSPYLGFSAAQYNPDAKTIAVSIKNRLEKKVSFKNSDWMTSVVSLPTSEDEGLTPEIIAKIINTIMEYGELSREDATALFEQVRGEIRTEPYYGESHRNSLVHEIQHAIQHIEGFAEGANPYNFEDTRFIKGEVVSTFEQYRRTAGEVEARNVQNRLNLRPWQRHETLLAETEDVAREDQLFLYDGLASMAMTEPNDFSMLFQMTREEIHADALRYETWGDWMDADLFYGAEVAWRMDDPAEEPQSDAAVARWYEKNWNEARVLAREAARGYEPGTPANAESVDPALLENGDERLPAWVTEHDTDGEEEDVGDVSERTAGPHGPDTGADKTAGGDTGSGGPDTVRPGPGDGTAGSAADAGGSEERGDSGTEDGVTGAITTGEANRRLVNKLPRVVDDFVLIMGQTMRTDMGRFGAVTAEDAEWREQVARDKDRIGREVHPYIRGVALRMTTGKRLSDTQRRTVMSHIRRSLESGATAYRELYASLTGDGEFISYAEHEIPDAGTMGEAQRAAQTAEGLTAFRRTRLAEQIIDKDIARKIRAGTAATEEITAYLKHRDERIRELNAELKAAGERLDKSMGETAEERAESARWYRQYQKTEQELKAALREQKSLQKKLDKARQSRTNQAERMRAGRERGEEKLKAAIAAKREEIKKLREEKKHAYKQGRIEVSWKWGEERQKLAQKEAGRKRMLADRKAAARYLEANKKTAAWIMSADRIGMNVWVRQRELLMGLQNVLLESGDAAEELLKLDGRIKDVQKKIDKEQKALGRAKDANAKARVQNTIDRYEAELENLKSIRQYKEVMTPELGGVRTGQPGEGGDTVDTGTIVYNGKQMGVEEFREQFYRRKIRFGVLDAKLRKALGKSGRAPTAWGRKHAAVNLAGGLSQEDLLTIKAVMRQLILEGRANWERRRFAVRFGQRELIKALLFQQDELAEEGKTGPAKRYARAMQTRDMKEREHILSQWGNAQRLLFDSYDDKRLVQWMDGNGKQALYNMVVRDRVRYANKRDAAVDGRVGRIMDLLGGAPETAQNGADAVQEGKDTAAGRTAQQRAAETQPGADEAAAGETKNRIIANLERLAVPMEKREFSRDEFNRLFPRGDIDTPIGKVKLGKNQFEKLRTRDGGLRQGLLGAMSQTLSDPVAVIQEERDGKQAFVFIKSFSREDTGVDTVMSVVVPAAGEKFVVSVYKRKHREILKKIKMASSIVYEKNDGGGRTDRDNKSRQQSVSPEAEKKSSLSPAEQRKVRERAEKRIKELGEKNITIEGIGPRNAARKWQMDAGFALEEAETVFEPETNIQVSLADLMFMAVALDNKFSREHILFGNLWSDDERAYWEQFIRDDGTMPDAVWGRMMAIGKEKEAVIRTAIDQRLFEDDGKGGRKARGDLLKIVDAIRDDFEAHWPEMKAVFEDMFNQSVEDQDSYLPIIITGGKHAEAEKRSEIEALTQGSHQVRISPDRGAAMARIDIGPTHQQEIETDIFKVFFKGVEREEHFAKFAPYVRDVNNVLRGRSNASRQLAAKLTDLYGGWAVNRLYEHVNMIGLPPSARAGDAFDNAAGIGRLLAGNMSVAYIAFNIPAWLAQYPNSIAAFFGKADARFILSACLEVFKPGNDLVERVYAKSPKVKQRVFNAAEEYQRWLAEQPGKWKQAQAKLIEIGMMGQRHADRTMVAAGWWALYQTALKNGKSEEDAVIWADEITAETQPDLKEIEVSPLFRDKGLGRLFLRFAQPLNVIWQNLTYDSFISREKSFGGTMARITAYGLAALAVAALRGGLAKKDGEDREPDELMRKVFYYLLVSNIAESTPLVGNMVSGTMEKLITGEGQIYQDNYFELASRVLNIPRQLAEEDYEQAWNDALRALGLAGGLPVSQINRMIKAVREESPGIVLGFDPK